MGNYATIGRRAFVPFDEYGTPRRGGGRMREAPPVRTCDCGREHWRPDGKATCLGCELDAHLARRRGT